MHSHSLARWQHAHDFARDTGHAEKGTLRVMFLTASMMVVEIIGGSLFGSMALLADGWHMATHVAAFAITVFAYRYARQQAKDKRFAFGTGKVSVLGGFASAVALAVIALVMAMESVGRFFEPLTIRFNEAIAVAVIGLLVNLLSGFLLKDRHEHSHESHGHHSDHNLRAAYLHVLADALTSVLAIIALIAGKYFAWTWLDPLMGLVGAAVITRWSYGLLRDTSFVLLDAVDDDIVTNDIRQAIESDADNRVADLHLWAVAPGHYAATVSVVTHHPEAPEHYRQLLKDIPHLSHTTFEVHECSDK